MPQILQKHVLLELIGISQIAVVRQHQTERRIDVKRLCLGRVIGRACGRITTMSNAPLPHQATHVTGTKHIANEARAFVHVKTPAFTGRYAGRILTTVLQDLKAVIQQLIDW